MTPEILLTCTPRFNWNHPSIVHDDSFNLQRWVSLALTLLCSDMDRCPATFQGVFNQLWVFFGLHLFFGNGGEVLLIFLSSVRKEKIYVNSTSVTRSTPLSVPTDQRYWLHNALFTWLPPPPFVAIIRRRAHKASHSRRSLWKRKVHHAIMRRAMAVVAMMAFCAGTHGFETFKSCF